MQKNKVIKNLIIFFRNLFEPKENLKPLDFLNYSYSQEGEDLILKRIFINKKSGFYVDVGACHPFRFSNTFIFYLMGWRGINVDSTPGSMKLFKKYRPRDINIESAVSNTEKNLPLNIFNEPPLNTFSPKYKKIVIDSKYILTTQKIIRTKKLVTILNKYLNDNQEIDFLSIDVEGLDLEVLKSNDWIKYRPKIILIEDLNFNFSNKNMSKIYNFMYKNSYSLIAKTINTIFFKNNIL